MEKRRITFKEILCLLVLLTLAAGAYFWSLMQPDGGTVVIEQDGEELYRIDFTARTETETLTVNGTVIGTTGFTYWRQTARTRSAWKRGSATGSEKPPYACRSASASASSATAGTARWTP